MTIKQVREPGRERPYITIVDTGLALAACGFLSMLELWCQEEGIDNLPVNWKFVHEMADGLRDEIERRTF